MTKTTLMPPIAAINLLWGVTSYFAGNRTPADNDGDKPDEQESRCDVFTTYIKPEIDLMLADATKEEKSYLLQVRSLLIGSLRNAGIIYKGRLLNYAENKKMRDAHLASLEKKYDFSGIINEAIKKLPGVGGGGATGVILVNSLSNEPGVFELMLAAVLFGFVGYVFQLAFSRVILYYKSSNFIRQDFEMTSYYVQYLERMEKVLKNLFDRIELIHESSFGNKYYEDSDKLKETITELIISENKADNCKHIDLHMKDGKINAENWYRCEVGGKSSVSCPEY